MLAPYFIGANSSKIVVKRGGGLGKKLKKFDHIRKQRFFIQRGFKPSHRYLGIERRNQFVG